jgi:hypothetical protein
MSKTGPAATVLVPAVAIARGKRLMRSVSSRLRAARGILIAMDFVENGFAVLPSVLSGSQCESAVGSIQVAADDSVGSRALLSEAWCRTLARSLRLHRAVARLLPVNAIAAKCTLFEKSPQRNWLVSLHQDLSIPVQERVVSDELSGWSEKEGCVFVQPPVSVLESLVAVRVHLDQGGAESGALRVVPGSHRFGRLVAIVLLSASARRVSSSLPCTGTRTV